MTGNDDILIYALNSGSDEREVVSKYWSDSEFTFEALLEKGEARGRSAANLGVQAYPTNIVVGPDGKVRYASVGYDEAAIRRALGL